MDKLFTYLEAFGAEKMKEAEGGDHAKVSIKNRITKNNSNAKPEEKDNEENSLVKRASATE